MLLVLRDKSPTAAIAPAPEASGALVRKGDGQGAGDAGRVAVAPQSVTFTGWARSRGELLRSPVSGQPCVHWRLRIAEQVNPSLRLVHEVASTEDFDIAWGDRPEAASGVRLRVSAETTNIEATPVLHAVGSPGALAIARQFGFAGALSVEEVMLRENVEIVADGYVDGVDDSSAPGPFRGVAHEIELLGATVRVPGRAVLAPVLLPWALGTAAALLGGVGAATWAAYRFDLVPRFHGVPRGSAPPSEIGPKRFQRRHFSLPE
jgi:hypothetical protein